MALTSFFTKKSGKPLPPRSASLPVTAVKKPSSAKAPTFDLNSSTRHSGAQSVGGVASNNNKAAELPTERREKQELPAAKPKVFGIFAAPSASKDKKKRPAAATKRKGKRRKKK
jgi:hypothetical protein